MIADYHIHTPLCHHATGEPEEFLNQARLLGLKEIGFADHFPMEMISKERCDQLTMSSEELPGYIKKIEELGENNTGIIVRLGVELDYIQGKTEQISDFLSELPLDYIIGSLHFLGDWDFTNPKSKERFREWDMNDLYRQYFSLVWEACNSGIFDIFGHIDGIKKFGYRPQMSMRQIWQETAAALKENGICLELNTAGLVISAKEAYPAQGLLEHCFKAGVSVTLGSDAHRPDEVGRFFDQALKMLYSIGYREVTCFEKRSPRQVMICG